MIVLLQRWYSTCHLAVPPDTEKKKQERPESGIYLNKFEKKIFNEHPVLPYVRSYNINSYAERLSGASSLWHQLLAPHLFDLFLGVTSNILAPHLILKFLSLVTNQVNLTFFTECQIKS